MLLSPSALGYRRSDPGDRQHDADFSMAAEHDVQIPAHLLDVHQACDRQFGVADQRQFFGIGERPNQPVISRAELVVRLSEDGDADLKLAPGANVIPVLAGLVADLDIPFEGKIVLLADRSRPSVMSTVSGRLRPFR
jgi:hypothetical protein